MGNGLLECDHTNRNIAVFVSALLICGGFSAFFFIKSTGCRDYVEHLKSCTPHICVERVMGFDNKYGTHKALTLRREIVGLVKDKFFDFSTCHVVETDDISKNEHITCKYTDKTRQEVIKRASILFGDAPLASDPQGTIDEKKVGIVRASYAARTPEQEKECSK